jgi:hypothetical protein
MIYITLYYTTTEIPTVAGPNHNTLYYTTNEIPTVAGSNHNNWQTATV